jgi:hypothetical protein
MSLGEHNSIAPASITSQTAIDDADAVDEAWAILSESLVIREQLSQACTEVRLAIDSIKARLDRVAVKIIEHGETDAHPADQLLRRRA